MLTSLAQPTLFSVQVEQVPVLKLNQRALVLRRHVARAEPAGRIWDRDPWLVETLKEYFVAIFLLNIRLQGFSFSL